MSPTDEEREELADWSSDRALWRRSCLTDAPEDEASRFLDLAAFADEVLEPEERERVAALLARDPATAEDVAAARRIVGGAGEPPARLERIVTRACAAFPGETNARVVTFARPPGRHRILHGVAQWGSLAAAIMVASWLGFSMGSDTSIALSQPGFSSDSSYVPELFDPGTGFLRDFGESLRS